MIRFTIRYISYDEHVHEIDLMGCVGILIYRKYLISEIENIRYITSFQAFVQLVFT